MTAGSCFICGTPTTKSCSSCKSVFYCTKDHQNKDWKSHKEYCLKVKAAANTFDAILFAVNETKPRLVKVPWKVVPVDKDNPVPWVKLDRDIWFKQPDSAVRSIYVQRWGINGSRLKHALRFTYDDNFGINNSPVNRCIESVTKGKAGHRWCGNILAFRMGASIDDYKSVNMQEDLEPLVAYLEDYGRVKPVDPYYGVQDGKA